jgi:glycosyltransferase involved in cell wall biosynthesis
VTSAKPIVFHVITRLIVGGAQLSMLGLCDGLREQYDVRLLSGPETGPEGSLHEQAAEVVPLMIVPQLRRDVNPPKDFAALAALRRAINDSRPAIVHTHSSKAGILGRAAAMKSDAKRVHTVHGWGHTPADSAPRRAVFVQLERVTAKWTDALVAVSPDVRNEGLRRRIGNPRLYEVIPEFVDYRPMNPNFEKSRQMAREALGLLDGDEVVGWVGRFVPQKDPHTRARALELVLSTRSTARAVLVGDGPLRQDVEQRLRGAGLAERVVFAGLRQDARSLYAAFDVLLHPSLWEGQPRVIQEAIAERIPVVATQVEGAGDLVTDGRTGYLAPPGDAEQIAARALDVLAGECPRAPLDETVIGDLARRYGRELVLHRHLELYERLLASPQALG